jgi:hypothetical protein
MNRTKWRHTGALVRIYCEAGKRGNLKLRGGISDKTLAAEPERDMSDNGHFEIPKEMRSMAEASFEQARKAFEKFLTTAQETAETIDQRGATMRAGAKDIGTKAFSYAERNVQASLDYAQ